MPRLKLVLVGLGLLAALAEPAFAQQPRPIRGAERYRQDLRECLVRNAGWASSKAEATRDTVADYAASKCEKAFVRAVTARRLMTTAEAKVEVNVTAYQFAERILSR